MKLKIILLFGLILLKCNLSLTMSFAENKGRQLGDGLIQSIIEKFGKEDDKDVSQAMSSLLKNLTPELEAAMSSLLKNVVPALAVALQELLGEVSGFESLLVLGENATEKGKEKEVGDKKRITMERFIEALTSKITESLQWSFARMVGLKIEGGEFNNDEVLLSEDGFFDASTTIVAPDVMESFTHAVKKALETPDAPSISKAIDQAAQDICDRVFEKYISSGILKGFNKATGATGENVAKSLEQLRRYTRNDIIDPLVVDVQNGIDNAIEHTQNKVKQIAYSLGKKILIGGAVVGTGALAYYIFKRYTHPGSLNKADLAKSKLLVQSSGFTNSLSARIIKLFKNQKEVRKVILAPHAQQKARDFIRSFIERVRNLKRGCKDLRFESILLQGPKGTGKTLFADNVINLSQKYGLDYLRFNSSSFIKIEGELDKNGKIKSEGKAAAQAVGSILNLLKKPKKEIVIVIDEVDIILNRPAYKDKFMNLLRWIKTNNHKFMLVFCAENKDVLDKDLLALVDQTVEFNIPQEQERKVFLKASVERILKRYEKTGLAEIVSSIFKKEKIDEIARQTEGYSFGQLERVVDQIRVDIVKYNDQFTKEHVNAFQRKFDGQNDVYCLKNK